MKRRLPPLNALRAFEAAARQLSFTRGAAELGVTQAQEAGRTLAGHDIRRIIASPYSRTLETADIIAKELGLPVTIERLVHERAFFICDIGSPRSHLTERWPSFDFGDLEETWWPENESEAEINARCDQFRSIMAWPTSG